MYLENSKDIPYVARLQVEEGCNQASPLYHSTAHHSLPSAPPVVACPTAHRRLPHNCTPLAICSPFAPTCSPFAQEIFTYTFAPNEVYINARWYYRADDTHE